MEKELENLNEEGSVRQEISDIKVEEKTNETASIEEQPVGAAKEENGAVDNFVKAEENLEVKAEENLEVKAEENEQEVKRSNKRVLQGKVVSNKSDKTIIIKVVRQVAHPLYKKYYKKTNKFMAHDEMNECNTGDVVRVRECRPLSARKCWKLVEIIEKAK